VTVNSADSFRVRQTPDSACVLSIVRLPDNEIKVFKFEHAALVSIDFKG
jgi:hypothetical protein